MILVQLGQPASIGPTAPVEQSVALSGFQRLSGRWVGIHLTTDENGPQISKHYYDLVVTKDGLITGSLVDSVGVSAKMYELTGEATAGWIRLMDLNEDEPMAVGLELYANNRPMATSFEGGIIGKNYAGDLFFSPILICQKERVTTSEFRDYLAKNQAWHDLVTVLDSITETSSTSTSD